ncbi:PREDICTED: uncharacterized protein LOC104774305 [Camelina sativa]|uniref:Uncharacterized protein LOC104743693 n=1 Tax=Camelina sativa TaxID=90675 RepID=A0ABM0VYF6_CAMSA|nr:PREDICTED: uncharacterized protein LOC104743693 [Camelina sativa]XP_010497241.1 PREDICTED: uncharacterized protein LOC104774305 [Camelina sativa]
MVDIVESSDQFIHARVVNGAEVVHVIAVYAAPTVSRRSGLWTKLHDTMVGVADPLIVGGDFNTIIRLDERSGGNGLLSADSLSFGDWIISESLIDMGFRGNKFTWRRGKIAQHFVAKRLDRVLCCAQARIKWQEAIVSHLPFLASDHAPVYVQLSPMVDRDPRRRPFRFEAAWLSHGSFKELLEASWRRDLSTIEALDALKMVLKKWHKEVFGDVHQCKEKLLREIKEVQDSLDVMQTDDLLHKEERLGGSKPTVGGFSETYLG